MQVTLKRRNEVELLNNYPALSGSMYAGTIHGPVEKIKETGKTYVILSLYQNDLLPLSLPEVAAGMTSLENENFKIFLSYIQLITGTPGGSSSGTGTSLGSATCSSWISPPINPPCIVYVNDKDRVLALKARDLLKNVQNIPDQNIRLIEQKKLNAEEKQLLELSHVDIVIVLGRAN